MKQVRRTHSTPVVSILVLTSLVLGGCLKEKQETNNSSITVEHEISGSVGDGPIIGAAIRLSQNDGLEIANVESDARATYTIDVRVDASSYPLSLHSTGGIDVVTNTAPDFDQMSAVIEPASASVANINPFSTLSVELARTMPGGENASNLVAAQTIVVSEFNHGLMSVAASGPMTTAVNNSNISQIVRASEALAESIRRTRNALAASGFSSSGNAVVQALAADLADGVVDGLGGAQTDPRYAAVSTIVAAQVLLETMANELHVNGADATLAMSNAIAQVSTRAAAPTLDELTTTAPAIARARIGLDAAFVVSNDPLIEELHNIVSDMQPNTSSQTIKTFVLPADYRSRLDNVILLVAGGDSIVHETVNEISRNSGSTPTPNSAPTISGVPASSVTAGATYSFIPTASDADGDILTFEISNQPAWANFNTTTGELSGTPTDSDVNVYSNILVSVSDGEFTSSLPTFSITVNAQPPSNSAPTISGTPSSSVLVGDTYSFTPTANDPDGDSLQFSVSGLPSWASFSVVTGQISGTPASADVGTYTNISISVSDGQDSAQLQPFSITVNDVALGSVTLNWTPPTQNTDGSALTDLAGYNIYWGTEIGSYPNKITINNASVSTFVVEGLAPGTYQFVATALSESGIESSFSNVAEKTLP